MKINNNNIGNLVNILDSDFDELCIKRYSGYSHRYRILDGNGKLVVTLKQEGAKFIILGGVLEAYLPKLAIVANNAFGTAVTNQSIVHRHCELKKMLRIAKRCINMDDNLTINGGCLFYKKFPICELSDYDDTSYVLTKIINEHLAYRIPVFFCNKKIKG